MQNYDDSEREDATTEEANLRDGNQGDDSSQKEPERLGTVRKSAREAIIEEYDEDDDQ